MSWNHIGEIVRQLRGECGARQIEDAEILQWGQTAANGSSSGDSSMSYEIRMDMPLAVVFDDVTPEVTLPRFRPSDRAH